MKRTVLHRSLSFVTSFFLVLQSFLPFVPYLSPSLAYAQETVETQVEQTVTEPAGEETSAPAEGNTVEESSHVLETPETVQREERIPEAEVTQTDEPVLTVSLTPTPEASGETGQEEEIVQLESTLVTEPTGTPSPTPEADFSITYSGTSATLSTDKPDYFPGDTALISGSGLIPDYTYALTVSSDNIPATTSTTTIISDASGSFSYSYQLDSYYRPFYSVVLKDGDRTVATTTFTDAPNPSANLDQCANDPFPSPSTDGCNTNANEWVNGNLNSSKTVYYEGDSVPYRMRFDDLATTGTHTVTIEWDTTKSGKHALDYLTTFNRTVATANPCLGVTGCNPASYGAITIPADPQVTDAGVTPVAGEFRLYGGTIDSVSTYSYADGTGFSGDKSARITLTFTASAANAVLAWGGHISTRADWGLESAAVNIPGSPYHMRLIDLDGKGGNQDRSLSAGAVIFPGSITIIKAATPEGSTSFAYTASPAPLTDFSLVDDGSSANTRVFGNIVDFQNYTVSETSPDGWTLNGIACSVTSANGGSRNVSLPAVTIDLEEGENVTCTFTNQQQLGILRVIKHVVNNNGGSATASDFTLHIKDGGTDVAGSPAVGSETGVEYQLPQGTYVVSENTPPSGYTMTGFSGNCDANGTVEVVAGQTRTCTITNDDVAPTLTVIKHVINDNGGTATAGDFTMDVTATNPSPASFPGAEAPGTSVTLDAGAYSVSESGPDGYAASFSADCSGSISVGQSKTCTVTNDDIAAELIVIKHVVNDDGGTAVAGDFTMLVTGGNPSPSSFAGQEAPGTGVTINAGAYSVSETGPTGYAASYSSDCTGNIALGQTKTCTVTNDDIAPTLKLVKTVINDNGGTKVAGDWTLTATGEGGFSDSGDSATFHSVKAGVGYALSESVIAGYTGSGWNCTGGNLAGSTVTLALAENATCTIINDDNSPKLTIVKDAIPNDAIDFSFSGDLGSFTLDDDAGVQDPPGTDYPQSAMFDDILGNTDLAITETEPNQFWVLDGVGCVDNKTQASYPSSVTGTTLTVNLPLDADVTCTFTNRKITNATRTQGFWQTHTAFTSNIFATYLGGSMTIGIAPNKREVTNVTAVNQSQLFGGYYASISMKSTGKGKIAKRTALDHARMVLLQQLMTAKLNCAAFGCTTEIQTAIAAADLAYAGSNISNITYYTGVLDAYNNSGDSIIISPPLPSPGHATPSLSKSYADIPFWDAP